MAEAQNPLVDNTPIQVGANFPERIFTPPTQGMNLVNPITGQPTRKLAASADSQTRPEWIKAFDKYALSNNPSRSLYEASPQTFKPAEVNYDRYVNHPKFKELGFYPYADNENYYNKNSTLWDDVSRATPQILRLTGLGLTAGVRSMGNLLSGNPSFDDTQLADEFGNAVAIGQSSRKGLGSWINNFGLNAAYTVGILGELAIEEALLFYAGAPTGGASWGVAALRLGQAGKQLRSAWKAFGTVDAARDFYKAAKGAGSAIGMSLVPNTVTWAKGIKSADNLKDYATIATGFGNFYRDVRTVNLTLDESNMEGGFGYNDTRDQAIAIKRNEVGRDLTPDELQEIEVFASKAGLTNRLVNVPLIYITNKMTFDNAFRGFGKYLSKADDIASAGGKRLVVKSAEEISEQLAKGADDALKSVARVEDVSFLKDIKNPRKWANLAFKYTKANMSEGIQELSQEFIQGSTVDYYTSIYKDKKLREYYGTIYGDQLIAANNILGQSVKKSASENVFSGQGFDTFLQGFLTGGVISGGRKATTAIFDKTINRKEAAQKAEILKEFAESINNSALSTNDYIDFLNKENLVTQKEAFFEMNVAQAQGDQKIFLDTKRQAVRTNAYRLFVSGNYKYYKSFLEDMKGLTPEELNKLFSSTTEKGAEKIDELLGVMNKLEENYKDTESRFGKPYNPNKFNKDKEPAQYNQELVNYFAWEEAKKEVVFAKDMVVENAQRMQRITNEFSLKSDIANAAYSDFSVMFSEQSRKVDIQLLKQEIDLLEGSDTLSEEQKVLLKEKKARYNALDVFQSNLEALKYSALNKQGSKKGKLNKKEYQQLYKQYEKYVKTLGATSEQSIKDSFESLVDYYLLSDESAAIADTINTLINPAEMIARTERGAEIWKQTFADRKKHFEKGAKAFVNESERNQLVNELAEIGVQISDGTEYFEFMFNGTIPQNFVTEDGFVLPNTEIYNKIQTLIDQYNKNSIKNVDPLVPITDEAGNITDVTEKDFEVTEEFLVQKNEETGEFQFITPLGKYLTDIINKVYTDEAARRKASGNPMPSFVSWLSSKQGKNIHDAFLSLQERFLTDNPGLNEEYEFNDFLNWLSKNKDSVFVIDNLSSVGLDTKYMMSKYQDRGVFDNSKLKADQKLVSGVTPISGVFVVSTSKGDVSTYEVVNFENRNLLSTNEQDAIFETLQDAVDAQVNYAETNKETVDTFVFDGTVFTTGQIWNDGINDYRIVSKPSEMSAPNVRLKAVNVETGQEKIFAKSRSLLPGNRVDGKDSNRSYLLSVDKYNSVHANREGNETREDSQRRLSIILANTPKNELAAGLTVVIRPNPNYDKSKKGYLKIGDKAANPYIIEKSPKIYIELQFNGKTIGWLDTLQDVDFLDVNGKTIKAADISFELFQEFSNIKGNPFDNFRSFKKNLYNGFALWKNAEKLLNENNGEQIVLTGNQIQEELGIFNVGRSSYAYGSATINELAFNQLDGGYFIIEQRKQKVRGTITSSTRYITSGEYTPEQRARLEEEVEVNKERFSSLGRYVLAARQPNGNIVFIELKLPRLTEGQVTGVLDSLKKRSEYVKANSEAFVEDQTENNDGFNTGILDKMFVALPTSNLYIIPSLNSSGDLVLTLAKDAKGITTVFQKTVDVTGLNSAADLVSVMNQALDEARTNNKTISQGYDTTQEAGRDVQEPQAEVTSQVLEQQKANIEKSQRQLDGVESGMNPNANHPLFNVGQKHDIGNIYDVRDFKDERKDTTQEGVEVITKIWKPAELDADGKLTKRAEVEVTIFDSYEQAEEFVNAQYNKYKTLAKEKLAKANAELAALERASGTSPEARTNNKTKTKVTVTEDSLQAALGQTITARDIVEGNFVTNVAPEVVGATRLTAFADLKDKPARQASSEDVVEQHTKSQVLATLSGLSEDFKTTQSSTSVKPIVKDLSRWADIKDATTPYTDKGIVVTRVGNTEEQFGNPFIGSKRRDKQGNLIESKVDNITVFNTINEADQAYRDWLMGTKHQNIKPLRREWILKQINEGKLDGKTLLYYKPMEVTNNDGTIVKGGYHSHADTLAEIVEELRTTQPSTSVKGGVSEQKVLGFTALNNEKKVAWKEAYMAAIESGQTKAEASKTADANPKVKAILQNIKDIEDGAESLSSFKQAPGFTPEDAKSMKDFLEFVTNNLPDYFAVEQLETLEKNFKTGQITLGRFYASVQALAGGIKVNGVIQVSPISPAKYHEAFHGLFRLILNDQQINKLLASAKREKLQILRREGKTLETAIAELRATNPEFYSKFNAVQMEYLVYEEYLADAFESWKKDKKFPTDVAHKNLFARIVEWIRALLGLSSRNDIVNLFQDFDSGKFAKSAVATNRFTRDFTNAGVMLPAFKQILARPLIIEEPGADGKPVAKKYTRFFSGPAAIKLTLDIAAVVNIKSTSEQKSTEEILDGIIEEYKLLYNLEIPENYETYAERFGEDFDSVRNQIDDLYYIVSEKTADLKESILSFMSAAGYQERFYEDVNEDIADAEGDGVAENKISERGGFAGLSVFVRTYLGSITRNTSDQFGNTVFSDGTPMVQSVEVSHVYNGLLNALAGQTDQKKALMRLFKYAQGNPDTEAVVNTFFSDTGITIEDGIVEGPTKNIDLYQKIMKGFEQFSVNYKFIAVNNNDGNVLIYDANRKDRSKVQLTLWQQAYTTRSLTSRKAGASFIEKLATTIQEGKDLSPAEVSFLIRSIANHTGIHLHPSLVNYSLASARVTTDNATPEDIFFVNSFSEIQPISARDLTEIQRNLTDGVDLFVQVIDKTDENETQEGSFTRLKNIASSNVFFDETISSTSWKNAEGETVWNHQYSTYALIAVENLKNAVLNGELTANPFYENNLLLANPQFMSILSGLSLERIDGIAKRFLVGKEGELFENKYLEVNKEGGKTFGDMDSVEFLASMMALGSTLNKKTYFNEVAGVLETFATSTHIPSILEASSTSNIVNLPITKYFGAEGKLTKKGAQAIRNEIEREFDSIQRAHVEAERGVNLIKDYHIGKERGFKFSKMAPYMEEAFIEHLQEQAKNSTITFEEALTSFEGAKNITQKAFELLKKEADEFIKVLVEEGGLKSTISQGATRISIPQGSFLPVVFREGHGADGVYSGFVAKSLKQNIYQFYINDLMNSFAWNQLTKGDSVRNVKDAIDEVKRNKGEGAGGYSAYTEATDPKLGINHATKEMSLFTIKDPLFVAKYMSALKGTPQTKEQADAQMWITPKSFRHLKFGFGELDTNFAKVLDKIDQGVPLTQDEIFGSKGMIQRGTMLNSIKVVYYKPIGDGKYVKTSAFVLTKELTSVKNSSGNWAPLAGYEELHNIREALEKYEQDNTETLSALIPESASKLSKQNTYNDAASLVEAIAEKTAVASKLDMRLMFLQQKNPSNKMRITDPSQNKQIINLDIDRSVKVVLNGKSTSLGEISDMYEALSGKRYGLKYTEKRNKIFDTGKPDQYGNSSSKTVNVTLSELYKYAQETLIASGRGSQAEYFELDENNNPKYDHNNPIVQDVFVEMMLSYLSKGVLQEKVPGHTLTLLSDWNIGVVREVIGGTGRVVRRSRLKKNANLNELALSARNVSEEDYNINSVKGSKEGDLVRDRLRFNVTEYGKDGKPTGRKYAEVLLPAHFREIAGLFEDGEIPAAIAEMLGIRIPTQDKHSAMFIKVVDFLPAEFGSVIVSPRELIEISSADFDIDKLYASIKQWYIDKTFTGKIEVREYGKAETSKGKFKDFINFTLRENSSFKSVYSTLNPSKEALSVEIETFNATGILSADVKAILKKMNLPITAEAYLEKENAEGVPQYEGALNNMILDAKSHLLYNPETTSGDLPPAYQPADILPLQDVLKDLRNSVAAFSPEVAELLFDEKNYNTSGALGKFKARKGNKEGSVGIGPTVNALLQWSFLAKGGQNYFTEKFKGFMINGKSYYSYVDRFNTDNVRKGFVLSTLITAMVDNAKERMAERLGLSIEALGVVSHLVALGVPLKDSILFVNQPKVKEYYKEIANNKNLFSGTSKPPKVILQNLIARESTKLAEGEQVVKEFTTKDLEEAIANSGQSPSLNIAVLEALADQLEMTRYFGAIAKVVKLVKGFAPDMASFNDIQYSIDLLTSENSPYDFDAYVKSSEMYTAVLNIYKDIRNLLPSVLISKSPVFILMSNMVMNSVNIQNTQRRNIFKEELEKSILSYLTIKGFLKHGKMSPTLRAALSNSTIYADGNSAESAIHSLVTLRERYPKNYFINNYLIASPYDGEKNRTLLDLIESNSWTKINEDQKLKLQYSILELASDMKARKHFDKLLAYLIVKDGLQFKSGSFLNIVPPILIGSYFESAKALTKATKTELKSSLEEFFGENVETLLSDFTFNYLTSAKNSFYIPKSPESSPFTKLDFVKVTPTKLIVDIWPKDNVMLTIGGELLYDEKGNPFYTDEGEVFKTETSSEVKMDNIQEKLQKLKEATTLFSGTKKVAIGYPVVKVGDTLYKLISVKRFGNKSTKPFSVDKNGNLPNKVFANYFEYQKIEFLGSKAQFAGGWSLFGPVPIKPEVNPFRKAEVTNPQYSESAPAVQASAIQITSDMPKKLGQPNDLLLDNYGIESKFDKALKKFVYTDIETGEGLTKYDGLRPVEVLGMQPKELSQDSVEELPSTKGSTLAQMSSETPVVELANSKLAITAGPVEKLAKWFNSLSKEVQDNNFTGLEFLIQDYQYAAKSSGITVEQFIEAQDRNIC